MFGFITFLISLCSVALNASASSSAECLAIPTRQLRNGLDMPVLSLGNLYLVTDTANEPDLPPSFVGLLPERVFRQTELALSQGVRAFDTAFIYRSQGPMGLVVGDWLRTGRLQSREDLFITSKIFHPDATAVAFRQSHMPDLHNMTPEAVSKETRRQFEACLMELGMGYIDLMLLHWPSGKGLGSPELNRKHRHEAWKVLEEMYRRGWARAIGVSNFAPKHLEQLKEDGATIVPMVNQFEASVTLQYTDILAYCKANGIVPQAYSPLGRAAKEVPQYVTSLATKYGKDHGQISLRYLYQLGYAITYSTSSEKRMVSNTQIFDFELTDDEMTELNGLNVPDGGWGFDSPHDLD